LQLGEIGPCFTSALGDVAVRVDKLVFLSHRMSPRIPRSASRRTRCSSNAPDVSSVISLGLNDRTI
jgi:hypothetical protein